MEAKKATIGFLNNKLLQTFKNKISFSGPDMKLK